MQRTGAAQRKKVELKKNFSERKSTTHRRSAASYTGTPDWEGLEKFLYNEGAIIEPVQGSLVNYD